MSQASYTPEKKRLITGSVFGIVLLVVAYVVSVVISVRNTIYVETPTKPTLYIAHWQLERGYREALQAVIDEYEKLHDYKIEIKQMPIGERFYAQALNSQLSSGKGPDLCEMGMTKLASQEENTVRFFLPLSGYIGKPNVYNADNEMKDVPWRETLIDGMRGGFKEGLQEYYSVPTSLFSMRLFYNKKLLKDATGSDAAPRTFGEWMEQCRKIREWAKLPGNDSRTLPLVSCYPIISMQQKYEPAFTSSLEPKMDLDLDGTVTITESIAAFKNGSVSMEMPQVKALFETIRSIGDQMQQDFSGMDRQTAQFYFANGVAGFLWSGSWDASGTISQATAHGFEVGVCDLPLPAPDEPNGQYVRGRANDGVGSGGAQYGVSQYSQHPDVAIDFLRFFTSRRGNALFSRKSEWPALTLGVEPTPMMKPFIPNPRGFSGRLTITPGSRMSGDLSGTMLNFYQRDTKTDYAALTKRHDELFDDKKRGGEWAWWYEFDQRRRDVRNKERVMGSQIARQLALPPDPQQQERYTRTLFQQVIRNDALDSRYLFQVTYGRELSEF